MGQWKRPATATAAAVVAMSWSALAGPALVNGSFVGSGGWKAAQSAPAGCEPPYRVADSLGAKGLDGAAAVLGDNQPSRSPGCDPSYILQDFDCGAASATGGYCTVTFESSLWLVAGERAAVIFRNERSTVIFEIPGDRVGRSGRYAMSVPSGSRGRLVYAVWRSPGRPGGTRSVLLLKHVESYHTDTDITSPALTPLHAEVMPFDVGALDGGLVPAGPGVADCNRDGIPDEYEITQGMTADRNADGVPDDCVEAKRQIDWVLLGLGIVVLLAMLLRSARGRMAGRRGEPVDK
jgi:hypothetical protein